jgi:CRP-like cAMP-binding protein
VRDDAPPNEVLDALVAAGRDVERALREPAPVARLVAHERAGNRYELVFWVKDPSEERDAESRARTSIWYRLRRARLVEERLLASGEEVRRALATMPLFAVCSAPQIEALAASSRLERFGRGETLLHQAAPGETLYIVLSGALDVVLERDDGRQHVARVTAGGFVGERSLMTGEPRSATAIAAEDTVTIAVGKSDVLDLLRNDPQLASRIAEVMAARDVERERLARDATAPAEGARSLLARIRAFFAL